MYNKFKYSFLLLIPLILALTGCVSTSTSIFTIDRNYKSVDQTAKQVTSKLGMEEIKTTDSIDTFIRNNGNTSVYALKSIVQAQNDSSTKIKLFTIARSQAISDILGKTFTSFYLQSIDSNYAKNNSDKLFRLEPKSDAEMYRLNWISPSLGIHYIGKNNPFVGKADNTFGTIGFAFFDALGLFAAIGGPFIGKTSKDKIGISLTGILSLVGWRIIVPAIEGKRELEEYNNIVNSNYSFPIEIKRE